MQRGDCLKNKDINLWFIKITEHINEQDKILKKKCSKFAMQMYYLSLIYGISYDCDNVCVLFFCLMIDDEWYWHSNSYRSQIVLPIHFVGTQGTRHDSAWFHPVKKFYI